VRSAYAYEEIRKRAIKRLNKVEENNGGKIVKSSFSFAELSCYSEYRRKRGGKEKKRSH
jgi:hypothetical protein